MHRTFGFCFAVTALCCILAVSAMATPSIPYSHYDAWFQSDTVACAGIYRCSCNPIDNYLYASVTAQYEDVYGRYRWTDIVDYGADNIRQSVLVVSSPAETYINYVDACFTARCRKGSLMDYHDSDSR